jgi:outer membrane protein assembly factor BamB
MCAIDANTGKESWCFEAKGAFKPKGIWSSPCHANGKIYFGAYNGDVYCLDAKSGSEVWSNPCCEWVGSSPLLVTEHDLVFIGLEYEKQNKKGSIAALSARTGQKKWEHWLDQYQHGSGVYWRKGDLVIFGTNDHTVVALSAPTGKLAWQFKTGRSVKHAPAIDGETGIVAFASFDKSIYILDVATGEKKAEIPTQNICYTTPLIHDGLLFCGSGDRHLYVVSLATMSLIKKIEVGARVYSSPRVVAGRVIFGTSGGRVIEVDPQSLEIVGVTVVPDAVTNAIAVAADGSRIFVPTYMNEIYCVERLP